MGSLSNLPVKHRDHHCILSTPISSVAFHCPQQKIPVLSLACKVHCDLASVHLSRHSPFSSAFFPKPVLISQPPSLVGNSSHILPLPIMLSAIPGSQVHEPSFKAQFKWHHCEAFLMSHIGLCDFHIVPQTWWLPVDFENRWHEILKNKNS